MSTPYWQEWQQNLRSKLSDAVFNENFSGVKPLMVSANRMVLSVPPHVKIDILQQVYKGLAEFAWAEVSGQKINFEFTEETQTPSKEVSTPFTQIPRIKLNPEYTFENFVSGSNSDFAIHSAQGVTEELGNPRYNPLLIYSGSGLGKTHLLQSIGNRIRRIHPEKVICYIPADDFTREYTQALQHKRIEDFNNYYRNQVDILLLDDIHNLSGREGTQTALFHIFNTMHQAKKQIVLTSDTEPRLIEGLHDRLLSRFSWGLVVDIQPPEIETREAILRHKAEREHLELSEEVIDFIAKAVDTDIRTLEGVIHKLLLRATYKSEDVSIDMARGIVQNLGTILRPKAKTEDVVQVIANYYNLNPDHILSPQRGTKEISTARQVAMTLLREFSNLSHKSIGNRFAGRDHATVIYAIKKVNDMYEKDLQFRREMDSIKNQLK